MPSLILSFTLDLSALSMLIRHLTIWAVELIDTLESLSQGPIDVIRLACRGSKVQLIVPIPVISALPVGRLHASIVERIQDLIAVGAVVWNANVDAIIGDEGSPLPGFARLLVLGDGTSGEELVRRRGENSRVGRKRGGCGPHGAEEGETQRNQVGELHC